MLIYESFLLYNKRIFVFFTEVKKGGKYEKTYKYPQPGVYVIKVRASNPHANFTQSHVLKAQRPVLPIYGVTTNSPQILPSIQTLYLIFKIYNFYEQCCHYFYYLYNY